MREMAATAINFKAVTLISMSRNLIIIYSAVDKIGATIFNHCRNSRFCKGLNPLSSFIFALSLVTILVTAEKLILPKYLLISVNI
jgi:hypothetical protein